MPDFGPQPADRIGARDTPDAIGRMHVFRPTHWWAQRFGAALVDRRWMPGRENFQYAQGICGAGRERHVAGDDSDRANIQARRPQRKC